MIYNFVYTFSTYTCYYCMYMLNIVLSCIMYLFILMDHLVQWNIKINLSNLITKWKSNLALPFLRKKISMIFKSARIANGKSKIHLIYCLRHGLVNKVSSFNRSTQVLLVRALLVSRWYFLMWHECLLVQESLLAYTDAQCQALTPPCQVFVVIF
jgi:hypothetical protein